MRDITIENFNEVLESEKPVLVDFWADWCGPCKMMAPVLQSVSEENDWLEVVKINADEQAELAKRYDIASIPTLLLFKKGKVVEYNVGALPKFKILGIINEHK